MTKVSWSRSALADLDAAAEFIARDSPYYAALFAREVLDAASSLDAFALRGRIVPEIQDDQVREVFVGRYRLIYEIEGSRIGVLALVHGARLLQWDASGKRPL